MIVDWNEHMFSRDTTRYPFHPDAVYVPGEAARSDDPLADYLRRMDADGIDRAVLVHPEPYGDDHRLVLDCLERQPDRFRATALCYPRDPDAPAKLRGLVASQPRIVAHRFHAHRGKTDYLRRFDDPGVVALWDVAAALGLIVELHIGPDYAAQVAPLVRAHPRTTVLIDHLAEPHLGHAVEYADVLGLADLPNVVMKLSGLGHFAGDGPLYPSARRFTRLVADAFGAERMVWGGGSPALVDTHLGHLRGDERAQVRGGNLRRLLGW